MDRVGTPQLHAAPLGAAHEAAVLHAAGFAPAAAALLEAEIEGLQGGADRQLWLMLHELHQLAGRRDAFDALALRFRRAFACANGPRWGKARSLQSAGTFALRGVLAMPSREVTELVAHAAGRMTLAVDLGEVERIDFASLGAFCAALRDLSLGGKRIILANVGELNAALLDSMDAGRYTAIIRRRTAGEAAMHHGAFAPRAAGAHSPDATLLAA